MKRDKNSVNGSKIALLEAVSFVVFVLVCMWTGEAIKPPLGVLALILIAIGAASGRYHKDTAKRLGFDRAEIAPAARLLAPLVAPLLLILGFIALGKEGGERWSHWFNFLGYPIWAFVQDYMLLSFVGNRLEDGLPENKNLIPWINGFFFGVLHMPNPILTVVTFIAGGIFTFVFLRHRSLWPIVISHALVGVGITLAFRDTPGIMSVGPAYLRRMGIPY